MALNVPDWTVVFRRSLVPNLSQWCRSVGRLAGYHFLTSPQSAPVGAAPKPVGAARLDVARWSARDG